MSRTSNTEVSNAVPQPKVRKRWRKVIRTSTAIGAAVLTAIASSATTVAVTNMFAPSATLKEVPVADVLHVDSLKSNDANVIGPQAFGAPIAGHMRVDLPSGKQIFAAIRGKGDALDAGSLRSGTLSFAQCSADLAAKTFDCGLPWLGKPGDVKDYFIYVGLADQNAAGSIIDALEKQAKSNDDVNWNHPAPPGFDTLPPIVVKRS